MFLAFLHHGVYTFSIEHAQTIPYTEHSFNPNTTVRSIVGIWYNTMHKFALSYIYGTWCIGTFQNISKRTLTIEPWSSSWSPKTRCRYGACLRIPFWPDVAKYVIGFRLLMNLRHCYNVCRIESWFAIISKFSTVVVQLWPIRNYSTPQRRDLTITWKHQEQMRDAFSKQCRHRACWNNSTLVVATVRFYLIKIQ